MLNAFVLQLGNVVCPLQWPPEGGLTLAPDRQLRGGHVPATPPQRWRGSSSFSSCDAEGCERSPLAHLPMVAEGKNKLRFPYFHIAYFHIPITISSTYIHCVYMYIACYYHWSNSHTVILLYCHSPIPHSHLDTVFFHVVFCPIMSVCHSTRPEATLTHVVIVTLLATISEKYSEIEVNNMLFNPVIV